MNNKRLQPLPLSSVVINDSFFSKYINLVADVIIPYQWKVLNDAVPDAEPSNCIANFKVAAGEKAGSFHGMVFQDTDLAKWLEAVAYTLHTKPDAELEKKADEAIELIEKVQQPDGYINTYYTLVAPEQRFQNLEESHELYTAGHFIEAAVAYYEATGKNKLLDVMCRFADLICNTFGTGEGQIPGYPGHQEIEVALIRLYKVTGERRYLDTAKFFIDQRGGFPNFFDEQRKKLNSYIFAEFAAFDREYSQSHKPVRQQDKAVGHAVRALYMNNAIADLAYEYGDNELMELSDTLWDNVVEQRMYITGSVGSSAFGERFTVDYDLPNDTNYSETCATIALAQWGLRLAQIKRNAKYIDVVEKALYNTLLSGVSQSGKEFFYVNPLEVQPDTCHPCSSKRHVKPVRQKWFACACCPPNIARTLASMGNFIYMADNDGVYVNLFIANKTTVIVGGKTMELEITTDFPNRGHAVLQVYTAEHINGRIAVRIPGYAQNYRISIDQEKTDPVINNGYALLDRDWHGRVSIEIDFDMPATLMWCNPRVRANIGKAAIVKGPLVYCLEQTDNFDQLAAVCLNKGAALEEKYEENLLGGVTTVHTKAKKLNAAAWDSGLYSNKEPEYRTVDIKAVPYYLWGNRDPGEMIVWLDTH